MSDVYRDRLRAGLRRNSLILAFIAVTALGAGLIATAGANAAVAPAQTSAPISTPSPTSTSPAPNTSPWPPFAPTDFTAVAHANSVVLSWTASKPGCCQVTGYDINYNQPFDDVVYPLKVGAVTTVTVTAGILPTREYRFSISAHDDLGHRSATVSLTVVTPVSDTAGDQTPPTAPANLTTRNLTASTVDLNWSSSSDYVGVVGYDVYLFDGWFSSFRLATVLGTSYTASLRPLNNPAGRNIFYVRARDAAGNLSAASNTVSVPAPSASPSASASPSRSPSSPAPSLSCAVTYTNSSVWHGGVVANITITNTGTTAILGWTLVFTFDGDERIISGWGAVISQAGQAVTARNADWNKAIPAGGSVSVGFQASYATSYTPPTAFTLNGVPCTVR
jgi:hypothetical protein